MNQTQYAIIAKCSLEEKDFRKWRTVTNIKKFQKWLTLNFPNWRFYNIYEKKTRKWIECVKRKDIQESYSKA